MEEMKVTYQRLFDAVEAQKELLLEAERWLWRHPEPGYREWKTHHYLKAQYEALGYEVKEAGNIPGFYVDIDTGRPGPRIAVFGEMDAIVVPDHPQCDPDTGAVHACGHHCQCVSVLGVAMALKAEHALDGLCGSIRLIAVPNEEGIRADFAQQLRSEGKIRMTGGKQEFLCRGYLDDVDMALMIHSGRKGFSTNTGCNGKLDKRYTFIGKTAHAAGPYEGRNALYAATAALNTANALRETFRDEDHMRFHGVIAKGGDAVNNVPHEVQIECSLRGLTMSAVQKANERMNRAFAASAAAMGCRLVIEDSVGYLPRKEDENMQDVFHEVAQHLFPAEEICRGLPPALGCTDMGDVSAVMPVCHAFVGGSVGHGHAADFQIVDPVAMCVTSAKLQVGALALFLCGGAVRARRVIDEAQVLYPSRAAYLEAVEKMTMCQDAVIYREDGNIELRYRKV